MKKQNILTFGVVLGLVTFMNDLSAQTRDQLVQRIQKSTADLQWELESTKANNNDLNAVLALVERARLVLRDGSERDRDHHGRRRSLVSQFACTDRDDDNRHPYVLSYTDENYNTIKITNVLFSSKESCESAKSEARYFREVDAFCIDKDTDNRAPWNFVSWDGNILKKHSINFGSKQGCDAALSSGKFRNGVLNFCVDKDADQRAPFVIRGIDFLSGAISSNNTNFSSMEECLSVLNSVRN